MESSDYILFAWNGILKKEWNGMEYCIFALGSGILRCFRKDDEPKQDFLVRFSKIKTMKETNAACVTFILFT